MQTRVKRKGSIRNIILLIVLSLASQGYAQSTSVLFNVNMNYQIEQSLFIPGSETGIHIPVSF